jgi:hypothetical protein
MKQATRGRIVNAVALGYAFVFLGALFMVARWIMHNVGWWQASALVFVGLLVWADSQHVLLDKLTYWAVHEHNRKDG